MGLSLSWITGWFISHSYKLFEKFALKIKERRADDPRLIEFIRQQIVSNEAAMPETGRGFERAEKTSDSVWAYAKELGIDLAYSAVVATCAVVYDDLEPFLPKVIARWTGNNWQGLNDIIADVVK